MIKKALATLALTACAAVPQADPVAARFGEADLPFRVDGVAHSGTATIKRVPSGYKLSFPMPPKTQVAIFRTCHRQVTTRNPGAVVEFYYMPVIYLESEDLCLATMETINDTATERLAIIDFTDSRRLTARVHCNGVRFDATGAYMCQSASGLTQQVSFKEATVHAVSEGCSEMEPRFGHTFEWDTSPGFCVYEFMAKSGEAFRLTTYGFGGEGKW